MNIHITNFLTLFIVLSLVLIVGFSAVDEAKAQGMMYWNTPIASSSEIAKKEEQGRSIFASLQSGEKVCADVSEENFELMGEYFMGQRLGASHESMNNTMKRMMGEAGEFQMHVVLGKRLSGCDNTAAWPQSGARFLPMLGMMGGLTNIDNANQLNNPNYMMYSNYSPFGLGFLGPILMILFWAVIIFGVIALVRYMTGKGGGKAAPRNDSVLAILKERYAKGEIDKNEFEDKKKDLVL